MKTMNFSQKCMSVSLAMLCSSALAAPGIISDVPLNLGTPVQPNILFMVDDSGSMDWEVLKSSRAQAFYPGNRNNGNLDITPSNNNQRELLESCSAYNVMYYNPTITYTPWVGFTDAPTIPPTPYADQDIDAASVDPYYSASATVDLTASDPVGDPAGYIPWNDINGDGIFDLNECGITASTATQYLSFVPVSAMTAAEQTNFANWYSYYRKREYVVKRALSEIITNNAYRAGIASLHNNNSIGTQIEDIDNISLPVNNTATTNKNALLRNLFRVNSTNGTPLRQNLDDAGQYFQEGVNPGNSLFGFPPNHLPADHVSQLSPILSDANGGSCQQNFTILLTDGFWNGGNPSGYIGNADGDNSSAYDGQSYADNFNLTLADVAMYYYETDLSATLNDDVPTVPLDTNAAQHMVTYTVAFGINGALTADPTDRSAAFPWPQPVSNQISTIDDVRHAAWNGRGEFLDASDPQTLIDSLNDAISGIQDRVGSAASVSLTSGTIATDTLVFQVQYNSDRWTGDLFAYGFDSSANLGPIQWQAGQQLTNKVKPTTTTNTYTARNIFTFNGDRGVPLAFPANYQSLSTATAPYTLAANQVIDLLANAPHSLLTVNTTEVAENQAHGESVLAFLQGDDSNEGTGTTNFRDRQDNYLGDMINSDPLFIGAPNQRYVDNIEGNSPTQLYSSFATSNSTRQGVVYVGANDGMLHAFNSDNGDELFAYMPNLVFSNASGVGVHKLAQQDYGHVAYVDGSISVADVYLDNPNVSGGDKWRSYLVGALRAGGKGVYVMDVTDPQAFVASTLSDADLAARALEMVVGEFTHPELGYTFSDPEIVKLNNGRWAAIFGNGYNNDPTGSGTAGLFIVYLDDLSFNFIDTGVGSMVNNNCQDPTSDCNGLSSPTLVDINSDSIVDYVYAGDLHGNMWRFSLTTALADYTLAAQKTIFQACSGTTATVTCSAANRQPITAKPSIRSHPNRRSKETTPNILVFFGTGQYIAENDNFNTQVQSFYGVWDNGQATFNRTSLVSQDITLVAGGGTLQSGSAVDIRTLTSNSAAYQAAVTPAEFGWYMDLPLAGERSYQAPILFGDNILFVTTTPNAFQCGSGGNSYLMAASYLTGGAPTSGVFTSPSPNNASDTIAGYDLGGLSSGLRLARDSSGNGRVIFSIDGVLADTRLNPPGAGGSGRKSWSAQ